MPKRPRPAPPRPAPPPRGLPPAALRWTCPPRALRAVVAADAAAARADAAAAPDARTRARRLARARLGDRPPLSLAEVVGQGRAVEALRAGLSTEAPGFHVVVVGPPGSGRESLVRAALAGHRPPLPAPRDLVSVARFRHPDRPLLLSLPRGRGRRFARDVDDLLASLSRAAPAALEDPVHLARCARIRRRAAARAARVLEDLAAVLRARGLLVGPIPHGFGAPELRVDAGECVEPLTPSALRRRMESGEVRPTATLRARLAAVPGALGALDRAAGEARAHARRGAQAVRRLEARLVRDLAAGFADDLASAHPTRAVRAWARSLAVALGQRIDDLFAARPREDGPPPAPAPPEALPPPPELDRDGDPLALFRVRVLIDAGERRAPPVVFEPGPTYANLFGAFEGEPGQPEHLRLRAGSLLRANGGVLVTDLGELLADAAAWRAVKRAVRSGWVEVARGATTGGTPSRPGPVRTAFKLVALATDEQWDRATLDDPDALDVFKVKAQVEDELPRTPAGVEAVGAALLRAARRAGLRAPDAGALARLLEHAARLAGRNDRLTLRFGPLLDVLQEADRLAQSARRRVVRRADVEAALEARRRRVDLPERRLQELLDDGLVLLDLAGARVGVAHALVVHDLGEHVFGRPCRVTAAVGVGRRGVVDIEREAHLSGDHHHKGVQILAGLLRERYAQARPLAVTASVCFEQSYSPIDGDSASLAEAVAVLSALGDLPVDQGLALTGSINQKGDVQPIGDPDAKVEGFFDACKARGLTGRQGVLIPATNVVDLMLRPDVVAACAAGAFRVVPVATLDEALTLLTGVPAGARPSPLAPFPPGTAHARVDARLAAYARAARGAPEEEWEEAQPPTAEPSDDAE